MVVQEISAGFPYKSNYIDVKESRLHYIDEGEGDPILFLHGNPTSSYLWRNIIPHLSVKARCIALDLIGMGKSDKPDIEYRFVDHIKYVEGFIKKIKLKNLTLVMHDWGSALGFHYAMRHERNIKGLAFMEAIIMSRSWEMLREGTRELFQGFRTPEVGWDMIVDKNMFIERVLPGAIVRKLSEEEMNRYREPFMDVKSRKPVWRWPNELPIDGEPIDVVEVVETYNQWLQQTALNKLLFYASPGSLLPTSSVEWCQKNLKNLKTINTGQGIHFLQEDNPHKIGSELANWYKDL